jgi:hypothetical protein
MYEDRTVHVLSSQQQVERHKPAPQQRLCAPEQLLWPSTDPQQEEETTTQAVTVNTAMQLSAV